MTSTPKKDNSKKHALTPDSKRQHEPSSKRVLAYRTVIPTCTSDASTDGGEYSFS